MSLQRVGLAGWDLRSVAAGFWVGGRAATLGSTRDGGAALDRYLGVEREAGSGLQRLGSRIYAAELGRFVSPDWLARRGV